MANRKYVGFLDVLEDEEYGIIVSADGKIKGVWVPKDYAHQDVPQPIVDFCVEHFGVDINEKSDNDNE
jgi:hypothetical protein